MNEFRHDKEFIAVLSLIIAGKKSKDDFAVFCRMVRPKAWAQAWGTIIEEKIYYE